MPCPRHGAPATRIRPNEHGPRHCVQTLYGKKVYENFAEITEPKHTALLVIGMSGPTYGDQPGGSDDDAVGIRVMLPRLSDLVERSRGAGILAVWIEDGPEEDADEDSPAWARFKRKRGYRGSDPAISDAPHASSGLSGAALSPLPGEAVVPKRRLDAFLGSGLDEVLRRAGSETVLVTGVATEASVESTARSALYHDYYTILISDCVASWNAKLHEASLKVMASQCTCATADQIYRAWEGR